MTFNVILILAGISLAAGLLFWNSQRTYPLLVLSALAIYAFQPKLGIRHTDFWFPTIILFLVVISWVLTAAPECRSIQQNWTAALLLVGVVLVLGLTRLLPFSIPLTASRPPQIYQILIFLCISIIGVFSIGRLPGPRKSGLIVLLISILVIFIFLKIPQVSYWASVLLHKANGQFSGTASPNDLHFLGFSYIAFRLIHTIRDRQSGRLPPTTLSEYVTYVIFFPALSAGPIDRIEHFVGELRSSHRLSSQDYFYAGKRLVIGMLKKFVIADTLAMIALNDINAVQARTAGWTWVLLYAYSFQIYFDFSGYTDIAIGTGHLMGIKLPENFSSPYTSANLTQFWNNWHITLTQWFRAYYFYPVTRSLRSLKRTVPVPWVILITQLATMILIGMWHGVTLNFLFWGLWHGVGLFLQNRWSEWVRPRTQRLSTAWQYLIKTGGVFLTFHYVALGWVFFALSTSSLSWDVFLKLFGLS